LTFLLACFEEKNDVEKRKFSNALFSSKWADPAFRRWAILTGAVILALVVIIILLMLFHEPVPDFNPFIEHMNQMNYIHKPPAELF
jgi:hypothetical protein